jgi:2-methylcitrate dehydratase PrpD
MNSSQVISSDGSALENVSARLAEHAAKLEYEMLPEALVKLTKQCVLDTLGVIIGASSLAPEAHPIHEFVMDMGGKPESSIFGFKDRAPAAFAAFVNGGLGHMLDYDDVGGGSHVSIATIPPALAIAERLGGVSGKELITAIAAGADVTARMSRAVTIPEWTMSEGWFSTQLFGYVSAATSAGRLLGLDGAQMENAFGIAFNQMCGSRQMAVGEASHMRSMQAGFSGQGGVMAALLAQRGITGGKQILEGRYGLFRTYIRTSEPDLEAVVEGMGEDFPLLHSHSFKIWPSCAYTRPTNAAIMKFWQEGLRPEDVESISIIGGSPGTKLLSEPIEAKRKPQLSIDAKYSIPFTTAVAMTKGDVRLQAYTADGLRDSEVLAMAERVSYRSLQAGDRGDGNSRSPIVEVRTRDGRTLRHQATRIPGDSSLPVSEEKLEEKFKDCLAFSAKPIEQSKVQRAVELIANLESLTDATEIVRILSE